MPGEDGHKGVISKKSLGNGKEMGMHGRSKSCLWHQQTQGPRGRLDMAKFEEMKEGLGVNILCRWEMSSEREAGEARPCPVLGPRWR